MTKGRVRKGGIGYLAKQMLAGFVICIVIICSALPFVRFTRAASPPNIIGYQGRLLNSNGVPVADATASIIFELYNAAAAGSCLWSNSSDTCATATARTVTLTDGLFTENLGDTAAGVPYAAISDAVFANYAAVYLQITVNGEAFTTRRQILAAPYALNSESLDGYNTTQVGGTSALVPVLDSTGNLQLTGNPSGSLASNASIYINPAGADTAVNDAILGVAVGGSALFTVDVEGDLSATGDLSVNGNDILSTGLLRITSGGAGALSFDSASGIVNIAVSDDFAVGGTSLVSPFSIDESLNVVRIGDGANDANDPKITFFASDASDSGTLSYTDSDTFAFQGGYLTHAYAQDQSALVADWYKSLFGSTNIINTSGAGVSLDISSIEATTNYAGALGAGSSTNVYGLVGQTLIDAASAVLTQGIGVLGSVTNQSTNVAAVNGAGYLAGGEFSVTHDSAQTISSAYGVKSYLQADSGTITTGSAVVGEVLGGAGSFTTGYGGRFLNLNEGATRYGVYAEASGGATANYAGYFASGLVQIDADVTADAMTFATGAGDLAVSDGIESHGGGRFGDVNGTDDFIFTTAVTTASGIQMLASQLTSGTGLAVLRADDGGGTAFSGKLVNISQYDTTSGAGTALNVLQSGTGDAIAVRIAQDTIADQTNGAGGTTIGGQALVLETLEAGSNDDIMLIRSNGQVVLAIESDGSVLSDNGYSAAGADYAEYFPTTDTTLGFYEVTCIDESRPFSVRRCEAGDQNLVGVISSDPGFIGNMPQNGATGNVLVGMVGQIDTYVNADEGAVEVGDPISTSSIRAGLGAKAQGPARIIGFALEARASGTGIIKVLVQPQWYGGDVLTSSGAAMEASTDIVMAPISAATATATAVASHGLSFRGSIWNAGSTETRGMSIETSVSTVDDYRMSVRNNSGDEVIAISDEGDFVLSGKLYPSDRGAAQRSRYVYYDGSAGPGGDFMRTNAAGWATGSYDFAEMFPSPDALSPGEVVIFGDTKEAVKRSSGVPYSQAVGVISMRPGFLAGENVSGNYPVALAGRVPTYVTNENGAIAIGDPLTTSSRSGYAMKATEAGPVIGYATESFSGTVGSIIVFINSSYFDGGSSDDGPAADNVVSELALNASSLNLSGTINLNGGTILSISSLGGIGGNWRLEEDGDVVTRGRLVQLIRSFQGEDVETYASASRQMTVELSGTARLASGSAIIRFNDVDGQFDDVISPTASYRVFLTPYAATGALYAAERTNEGFVIRDVGGASGVMVDWMVIAYHKDFEPEIQQQIVTNDPVDNVVIEDEPALADPESEEGEPVEKQPIPEESRVVSDEDSLIAENVAPLTADSSTIDGEVVTILDEVVLPSSSADDSISPLEP